MYNDIMRFRATILGAFVVCTTVACSSEGAHPRGGYGLTGSFSTSAFRDVEEAWSVNLEMPIVQTPVREGPELFVPTVDGKIRVLSTADGTELRVLDHGAPSHSAPLVLDGRVFAGHDRGLSAWSVEGEELWSFEHDAPIDAAPVEDDGLLFVPARDGAVLAIGVRDGKLHWTAKTSGSFSSSCALADGGLFCGGGDGYLWRLDPDSGEMQWSWSPAAPIRGIAWAGGELAVVAGSKVVLVGAGEPKVEWTWDAGTAIETVPSVVDGNIVVATARKVVALDSEGEIAWEAELESPARGGITSSGGVIYVPMASIGVLGLDESGKELWRFDSSDLVVTPPLPAGNLYVVDHSGNVTALQ